MSRPPFRRRRGEPYLVFGSRIPRYHPIRQIGRRTREWQAFRARFLAERRRRDRRLVCESCGREAASVDLHHIVRRSTAPEQVYETANLRVLCRSCHRREHA